jgi:hypothetical protein
MLVHPKKVGRDNGAHAAAAHGIKRSPLWPAAEEAHRKQQPDCVCCTGNESQHAPVQVHHLIPFHFCVLLGRADLELDSRNLLTLCERENHHPCPDHHLLVGHFEDWQSFNYSAQADAIGRFHGMSEPQLKISAEWQTLKATRPSHWEHMTSEQKETLSSFLTTNFPRALTPTPTSGK